MPSSTDLSDRVWWMGSALALLVAVALRFSALDLAIFHMDEGVNGSFMMGLVREGKYHYDPENYHGPTLYYLQLPFTAMFGFAESTYRMETATFGTLTVLLMLLLYPAIGRRAALAGAWLYTLSPGATYMSRYFIHESLFVCFALAMLVPWLYVDRLGHMAATVLSSLSAGLLFATKETCIIVAALFLIGKVAGDVYARLAGLPPLQSVGPLKRGVLALSGFCTFFIVHALFFTSFFTNRKGFIDAFRAFTLWSKTSHTEHAHPWWQWLAWLAQMELPILALGLLGCVFMLTVPELRTRFNILLGVWCVGTLTAYSILSYKTPWCAVNMILPLAICAGVATSHLSRRLNALRALEVMALASVILLSQCIYVCYLHYDDESLAYSYARTQRESRQLVAWINEYAEKMGTGTASRISWCAKEYWPLPWYLRDYNAIGWWSKPTFGDSVPDMVVFRSDENNPVEDETPKMKELMKDNYQFVGKVNLWNEVMLELWVRKANLK